MQTCHLRTIWHKIKPSYQRGFISDRIHNTIIYWGTTTPVNARFCQGAFFEKFVLKFCQYCSRQNEQSEPMLVKPWYFKLSIMHHPTFPGIFY